MTLVKAKTGTGKIMTDRGDLDLFKGSDGFILALKNLCRGRQSHHGDFARGDANFSDHVSFVIARISQS